MKLRWRLLSLIIAALSIAVALAAASSSTAVVISAPHGSPAARSLLSLPPDSESELAASLDGTVSLRRRNSGNVIWSFQSGSPMYSSYQAPLDGDDGPGADYFFDFGDDGELYAHVVGFGKRKLDKNIEELVRPHVWEDGVVTVGSKSTTVYVVDAMTGIHLQTYHSLPPSVSHNLKEEGFSYSKSSGGSGEEPLEIDSRKADRKRLHIIRTDYTLASFHPYSGQLSWNLTMAEIGAVLVCQEDGVPSMISTSGATSTFGSQISSDFNMPFPCQSKVVVIRERFHNDQLLLLPSSNMPPSGTDTISDDNQANRMLLESSLEAAHSLKPNLHASSHNPQEEESKMLQPRSPTRTHSSIWLGYLQHLSMTYVWELTKVSKQSASFWLLLFIVLVLLGSFIMHYALAVTELAALKGQSDVSNLSFLTSKRRRDRKSAKSGTLIEKVNESIPSEDDKGFPYMKRFFSCGFDGRTIGKLVLSSKEIAKGSNGTIVLEGFYEGRPVAVKRLVQSHHDLAFKEIQNLIVSDSHPNIVRWYGVEYDQDFVYLALERCSCSLNDVIKIYSDSSQTKCFAENHAAKATTECKIQLAAAEDWCSDKKFWRSDGHPTFLLVKLMRDIVSGLAHLHDLGIIHRDLKPQNVLINKDKYLCAKLSDMGISKRLLADMSSLGHQPTGCGSSGWQAPEQLLHLRQTRAVDLFGLGCVLFYSITGGRHPFGDHLERDVNIVKNRVDLFLVDFIPEAYDLISCLLNPNPEFRPSAVEVLHHPFFWTSETRLSFLRDASDRVEMEDRAASSRILQALENIAPTALGGKWDTKLEPVFINNIGHYRRYRFETVRDLLRVIRNKYNHFRELPRAIQELVGPVPEGFDGYFATRFPKLLIEVYKVVSSHCGQEAWFQKYIKSSNV